MTDSASLTMLKKAGAKAQAVSEELAKPTPPGDGGIEVDDMTSEQLDELCKENGVETPAEWPTFDAEAKKAWLKEQFDTVPDVQNAETAIAAPAAVSNDAPTTVGEAVEAAEQPKAAKKKTKKTTPSTAVTESTTKDGEIVEADVLQDMVHEIENLKEKAAYSLIDTLIEQTDVTYFKLGGVLSVCVSNTWFQGYPSFKEMLEGKYGFAYRKGMYLVEIYNNLSNSGIPWSKVSSLGWTKLQVIASVVTQENVDSWVQIAGEQNTLTLIETVKNSKKNPALTDQTETAKTVTTMSFKVHSDQKATIDAAIDKAKQASSTEVSTVALEYICLDYMGGQTLTQRLQAVGPAQAGNAIKQAFQEQVGGQKLLAQLLAQLDLETTLNAIGDAHPEFNITVTPIEEGAAA